MLEALKFFLRTRPKIEALSEDNVRSENAALRKKSKLIACTFQFNTLYTIFTHYLDYRACSYWHLTALSSLTLQKVALVLPPCQLRKLLLSIVQLIDKDGIRVNFQNKHP